MKEQESAENPGISLHCIDAIAVSLCIEKQGLNFYEKAAKKSQDTKVRKMFQHLADEEKANTQAVLVARCEADSEEGLKRLKGTLADQLRASGLEIPRFS